MGSARQKPPSFHQCAWCGERKPIAEMRHPLSSRGPTPSTCHACRIAHPDLAWCDHHSEPHAISAFAPTNRPIGVGNHCRDAEAYRAAAKRARPALPCASCGRTLESWYFRGGRNKAVTCRDCTDAHPNESWCVDCAAWLPRQEFHRTGRDKAFLTVRCKPCRITWNHGVTRADMARITGVDLPACGACGSTDDLKVDHSHDHCPAQRGCRDCVRGYLCHACNSAEGLLRTPERARQLATYMERVATGSQRSTL